MFSLARWGLKTYRGSKSMSQEKNGGFIEGFPQYDAEKNARRGKEGAQAAAGGVATGGTGLGLVLAVLVWLRSIGVNLPWPETGDLGFATIVGGILTPLGAYVTARIQNKAKYNRDAAEAEGQQ